MGKAQHTKHYILETSSTIFNKKGYAGTTFSDIIEHTGLSKGAIYGHFKNKDDLALAVLDHNLKLASNIIFSNVKDRTNSYDKLVGFARSYSLFYEIISNAGGCPVINAAVDYDDSNGDARKKIKKFITKWQNSIHTIVEEGIRKGEIKSSPETTLFTNLFISLIEGSIMLSKIMNERKHIDDASDFLVSLVEKMKA